jgi:L-fuconolactonase
VETVLEPGLSVCDPHHHLIDYTEPAYLMPQFLADTAAGHQVVQSVFVECMTGYRSTGSELLRPVGETELVVAADPSRFIAGIVGFADLRSPEVGDVLEAHLAAADGRFRGIRYAAATDPSPLVRDAHTKPPAHRIPRNRPSAAAR